MNQACHSQARAVWIVKMKSLPKKLKYRSMGVRQRENKGSSREDSCPQAGKDGKRKETYTACMHMCLKDMFKGPNTIL